MTERGRTADPFADQSLDRGSYIAVEVDKQGCAGGKEVGQEGMESLGLGL